MIKFYKVHTALGGSDNFLMKLNRTTGKITHIEANPFEPEIVRLDVEFSDKVVKSADINFVDDFSHLEIR